MTIFTENLTSNRELYSKSIDDLCAEHGFLFGGTESPNVGFLCFDAKTDHLIGYILYQKGAKFGIIDRLFVTPDFRKRGISRHLLHLCEEDCKETGEMNVSSQYQAIPFWEHMGYHMTNHEHQILSKNLDV